MPTGIPYTQKCQTNDWVISLYVFLLFTSNLGVNGNELHICYVVYRLCLCI